MRAACSRKQPPGCQRRGIRFIRGEKQRPRPLAREFGQRIEVRGSVQKTVAHFDDDLDTRKIVGGFRSDPGGQRGQGVLIPGVGFDDTAW